ncbi:MAG: hypothetical protein HY080_13985 [Gammaproteobacteria bacterium]|nr:hypothetical protein [Gammaproteobacteria bacterium]
MTHLVTDQQATTAQWHDLVKEAEAQSHVHLDEELESYLVFLLMRYTEKPEMAAKVMALEYLQGVHAAGSQRHQQLRDVGDQCLLYSGLFPRRAERRRVRISYYVDIGRSAYHTVAEVSHRTMAGMFQQLSARFVEMMDTLQAMRSLQRREAEVLDPIRAYELWNDTGSKRARAVLTTSRQVLPVRTHPKFTTRH